MTGAQFIVDQLIKRGVTDAFGIPGGVILDLIYEMDRRKDEITPHLSYHEQAAGFAACGYAQVSGKIGVAYATRGPGFTNLITAMADAYYDSLPVVFITAHAAPCPPDGMRAMNDQEMDTCSMIRNITKAAIRLNNKDTFSQEVVNALTIAEEGRKGPVFLDIATCILKSDVAETFEVSEELCHEEDELGMILSEILISVRNAKRPVILAGDGINQAGARDLFLSFVRKVNIPVISSRCCHDVLSGDRLYYGYVGSHGMRAANFILSKTDLILSLGNRLHFPTESESFGSILNHAKLVRVEVDKNEFNRVIPNAVNYQCDVYKLLSEAQEESLDLDVHDDWIEVCDVLKKELCNVDTNPAIEKIISILQHIDDDTVIVNDVGNNEFWVSRGCVESGIRNRVYYSKSFGTLGCALGKAIGAYYATKKKVLCFVGDQGFQMNIQELQYISQHQLPIMIAILNNHSSGMIKDREMAAFDKLLHVSRDTGFSSPDYEKIAGAYSLPCIRKGYQYPGILEVSLDDSIGLVPSLPRGRQCQDMLPEISKEKYQYLNAL